MRLIPWAVAMIIPILVATPVLGDVTGKDNGDAQIKNVQTGARNSTTGWVEIFDSVAAAEGKSKNTAEKFTGFIAGTGIGARKALHKTSAGLIDLGTFWMPKKEPLLNPKKDAAAKKSEDVFTAPSQNFGPERNRR